MHSQLSFRLTVAVHEAANAPVDVNVMIVGTAAAVTAALWMKRRRSIDAEPRVWIFGSFTVPFPSWSACIGPRVSDKTTHATLFLCLAASGGALVKPSYSPLGE